MKKFRLNAQDHIIKDIIECLECSIIGQGIAISWDYTLISENTIEFTLKEGKEVVLKDIFWFGYITAID
ncbi:hypothetical protein [Chryseobacterium arthrosphaerae]|uniref:hypothetical protein n=1 Tax=Chryseobacterium arthrosphaerae TaxID=651561 RepID=UPI003D357336